MKGKAIYKTYREFFRYIEKYDDDLMIIEKDGLKVTIKLTEKLMKELVSKCVHIYGLEAVVKSAVESTKETDAE